jgi:ABC-type uncharacterized transport system substrate-binding protein
MKRRTFITLLGGAAAMWPLAVKAQQMTTPVVGFMSALGRNDRPNLLDGFRRGLREAGYTEGQNLGIEYRFAENQHDRLPTLASELVSRKVAVIVAMGGGNSPLVAKAATTTIPIVFLTADDPVKQGWVASLNRPGGNLTGVSIFNSVLGAKGLGLLLELVPRRGLIGFLVNPKNSLSTGIPSDVQEAARSLARPLLLLNASTPIEIDAAFATLRHRGASALLVPGDPFMTSRRQHIVALAARDAIPTMYFNRDFVAEGGLMSYGNDVADAYRRVGICTGRILKGASPSDLPIDQATKFEFVINLQAAKALGLAVPPTLLTTADEVIE